MSALAAASWEGGSPELHISAEKGKKWGGDGGSPADRGMETYRWWARDVAASLQHAISEDVRDPKGKGSSEQVTISVLTRRIARQVALQIPKDTMLALVSEARDKMKVVEESCLDQLFAYDDDDEEDESPADEGASAVANQEMADILTRRIPQEMSKWIAKEIYSQLMAANDDTSSTEDDLEEEDDLDEGAWRGAAASFDVRGEDPAVSGDSGNSTPVPTSEGSESGDRRVYITDESQLRAEAFKKFKLVLARGNGFRVIKHNHGGGRKTRILKYNPGKNRIFWESSRVLGGERVSCSRIVKVHREATVVYVWHMTGGRHGSVKKMVGFETQREADARILELALMHLKEKGNQA